jgi:hypothetical protein
MRRKGGADMRQQRLIYPRSSRLSLLSMMVLLSACNFDRTAEPYAAGFVGHCFVSVKEAMFVSRECSRGAWKYCDAAEPIGPEGNRLLIGYPPTLKAFHDDTATWSARIHKVETRGQPGLERDHVVVYGGLPIGTTFTIVQAIDMFDGESGRYWMTYATMQDGEFKDRRVMLPKSTGSIANGNYVARCDDDLVKAHQ